MTWRMPEPCKDCPFNEDGDGRHLRNSLGAGRWRGILRDLRQEKHFNCHKTTDETGDGSNLVCAGAIRWQNARGITSNLQRVMERIAAVMAR